MARPR